jgi:hypothetical protein
MFVHVRSFLCLAVATSALLTMRVPELRGNVLIDSVISQGSSNSDSPGSLSLGFRLPPPVTVLAGGGTTPVFDYRVDAITVGATQTSVVANYVSQSTVTSGRTNKKLGTVVISGGGVGTYNLEGRLNEVFVNHEVSAVTINQQTLLPPGSFFAGSSLLFAFEEDGEYLNFSLTVPDQTSTFNLNVGALIQATSLSLDSITLDPDSNYQLFSSVPEPGTSAMLGVFALCSLLAGKLRRRPS